MRCLVEMTIKKHNGDEYIYLIIFTLIHYYKLIHPIILLMKDLLSVIYWFDCDHVNIMIIISVYTLGVWIHWFFNVGIG